MCTKAPIYINPLTDFGFKYLFGRNADKEFIISFLNALRIGPQPIKDVTFVDKENKGFSKEDRALIYDLHCELEDGSKIIVEMQNRYQTHFDDRAIYYLAADLYSQGQKGEWDYKLTPVYGVFLMNFEWRDVEEQHLREDVCLYNMQTKKVFSDKMRMTFIKIPMLHKDAEECRTTLERWIFILKNMENMEAIPQSFMQEPIFRKLGEVAQYGALSEKDRKAYNESLKAYRDAYAIAQTERAEGRAEGLLQGRTEGLLQGRTEGLLQGRTEGLLQGRTEERLAIASTMIKLNMSDNLISQTTGLAQEEIINLRKNICN